MRRTITKANVRASGLTDAEAIVNRHVRRAVAVLEAIRREDNARYLSMPK